MLVGTELRASDCRYARMEAISQLMCCWKLSKAYVLNACSIRQYLEGQLSCHIARHLASTFLLLYCSCPFRELGKNKAHVYTVHLSSIQLYPRNCPDTVSCSEFLKGTLHIYSLHAMSGYLTHGSLDAAQKALQPMTRELQNVHLWVCPFLTDTRKSTDDNALAKATVQALIAFLAWSVLSEHVLPACCNQP